MAFWRRAIRHHQTAVNDVAVLVMRAGRPASCASLFAKRNGPRTQSGSAGVGLVVGTADLDDHRRRNKGIRPSSKRALCSAQARRSFLSAATENGGVVDDRAHAGRRTVRDVRSCARKRLRRASFISSAVRRPCCFSHRATAAKPAAAAVLRAPRWSSRLRRSPRRERPPKDVFRECQGLWVIASSAMG